MRSPIVRDSPICSGVIKSCSSRFMSTIVAVIFVKEGIASILTYRAIGRKEAIVGIKNIKARIASFRGVLLKAAPLTT
jgi:hypothetical protein